MRAGSRNATFPKKTPVLRGGFLKSLFHKIRIKPFFNKPEAAYFHFVVGNALVFFRFSPWAYLGGSGVRFAYKASFYLK